MFKVVNVSDRKANASGEIVPRTLQGEGYVIKPEGYAMMKTIPWSLQIIINDEYGILEAVEWDVEGDGPKRPAPTIPTAEQLQLAAELEAAAEDAAAAEAAVDDDDEEDS